MLKTLTISGENPLQVKVFSYYADKALSKLYLPDFSAKISFINEDWNDVEFTLEIPSGLPYGAKEFLKLHFEIWAKKELHAHLHKFFICSKYTEDITKIKFKLGILYL